MGQIDAAGLVADGFDEGAQAEVAGVAQDARAGSYDEGEGFGGEGVVAEAGAIKLVEEELLDVFGTEAWQHDGVGDAGADLLMDAELEGLEQGWLADKDEVVAAGEVFAEEAEFAEAFAGHEMGVVDDGHEHLAGALDLVGFLNEHALAAVILAGELDVECFAEDAEDVVVGVECPVDDGGDDAFGIVFDEGVFEDAFAGAGFSQDEAESALLGVDLQDVEDFLLVGQQGDGVAVEGITLESKVGADHFE